MKPSRRTAGHLEGMLEFETLISDASARLMAVAPDQAERAIEGALDRVRAFFGADRCVLLSVRPDREEAHVHLASYAEGVPPVSPDLLSAAGRVRSPMAAVSTTGPGGEP